MTKLRPSSIPPQATSVAVGIPLEGSSRCPADSRLKDHFAFNDYQFLIQEKLHRLAQRVCFQVQSVFLDILQRVNADVDVEDVLKDDGAFVELLGDEVGRASMHADAAIVRL